MTSEECEISWINQTDVTPLLAAFPGLEVLRVRGGDGLRLSRRCGTCALRELAVESGGLPADVVRGIADSHLPALTTWSCGSAQPSTAATSPSRTWRRCSAARGCPALRRLALRNAEIADQVAAALAGAPVVPRLETLDLSLGILSDQGAEALLLGQPLTHLRRLDLSHHFISAELADRLRAELPGVDVDLVRRAGGGRRRRATSAVSEMTARLTVVGDPGHRRVRLFRDAAVRRGAARARRA